MNANQVLKEYFGYDSFRAGQEKIINTILSGQDALAIMPTGAGKSICYQVPALLLPGITIVISPLISLMQDQVKALNNVGIHAAYINSSLSETQITKALDRASKGIYKIVYVAPERLTSLDFVRFSQSVEISMVTVDEAHCISQWGQDFRPAYLGIAQFVNMLPYRPVVGAFTATATELNYTDGVTSNIQTQLNNKAASSHTHKYAGSSSAGGSATSAVKLDTSTAGSSTKPVYFSGGKPVACAYAIHSIQYGTAAPASGFSGTPAAGDVYIVIS